MDDDIRGFWGGDVQNERPVFFSRNEKYFTRREGPAVFVGSISVRLLFKVAPGGGWVGSPRGGGTPRTPLGVSQPDPPDPSGLKKKSDASDCYGFSVFFFIQKLHLSKKHFRSLTFNPHFDQKPREVG